MSDLLLTLDRGLLSDRIYDLVRAMIKDGTLEPGEQVVESQLARRLGVSQAPVREALKRLTHEGLITHQRHHGSFVTEYSQQEADDARIARVALEGLAGRLLHGHLSDEHRARLNELVEAMHDAATRKDIGSFRDTDFEFHRLMVSASGNTYLPRMWDLLEPSLRSTHVLSDPLYEGDWHELADLHRRLIEVLDEGDADMASNLFIGHAIGLARQPDRPVAPALADMIAAAREGEG